MSRFGGRLRGSTPVSQWMLGIGGTMVTSVQRGTITIASGATSNTATLSTTVDVNRTRVVLVGMADAGGDATVDKAACRLALTNATTLTATVNTTGTGNRVVSYEVIEYATGAIKSIQRGTITTTGSSTGTATITAVSTDHATVDYLGFTSDYSGAAVIGNGQCRVSLTNATTLTATGVGSLNRTVGYQVVEWY